MWHSFKGLRDGCVDITIIGASFQQASTREGKGRGQSGIQRKGRGILEDEEKRLLFLLSGAKAAFGDPFGGGGWRG